MATWTLGPTPYFRKDGVAVMDGDVLEALNTGEAAIAEVERLRQLLKQCEEINLQINAENNRLRRAVEEVERLRAEIAALRAKPCSQCGWYDGLNEVDFAKVLEASGKVSTLQVAPAGLVERLRGYANQLCDSRTYKGIGGAIIGILSEYSHPKPKVEWTQKKGYKGNTEWYANGAMVLWPIFEDDKVKWRCGGFLSSFDDLAEAKRAVEAKLKGGSHENSR